MTVTIKVESEMILSCAAELKARLLAAFAETSAVDLELSQVDEIDAAGVQILLLARFLADDGGLTLRLREPSEAVVDTLRLLRLTDRFQIASEPR
jgi:anti-sigma B factor antagonist